MKFESSTLRLFVGQVGDAVLTIVGLAYFTRTVPQAALGTFFLYQAVVQFVSIPTSFGRGGALIKRLSEGRDQSQYLGTAFVLWAVSSVGIALILWLVRPFVDSYLGDGLTLWLIVGTIVFQFQRMGISTLKGEVRTGDVGVILFVRKLIWVVGGALLITQGLSLLALVVAFVLGNLAGAAVAFHGVSTRPGTPSFTHFRSLYQYWKWAAANHLDSYLYSWADIALLGYFLGPAVVAAYEIAWRISNFSVLLSRAVQETLLPQISSFDAAGRTDEITKRLSTGLFLSLLLVLPIVFGAFVVGSPLLEIVFGTEYGIALTPLLILLVGKIVEAVDGTYKNLLSGVDKPRLRAIAAITSGIANILMNALLIPRFGIAGAAIATTLAFSISTVIILNFVTSEIDLVFPVGQVIGLFVAAIVMTGVTWGLQTVLAVNTVYELATVIVLGGVTYFLTCVSIPATRQPIETVVMNISDIYR
ncbi:oligosaccharide flippase family protein [Halosimplex rubrum]|uniref:Oligosaccharide flippase family protein n=1 Tax=Halosimplex rubrum TaxID=869889 RepID=A0A7D5T3F5_9EURY|nr:polysaccharide biosynthesis C-terminal domain-containing protein [Halosimplex rubrum]QLH76870.1 oligosaccharide flippase family protein [Halosimplex rubrum]